MSEAILHLEDVHKRFGPRISAQGFDLVVGQGEFVTLLGPSGSGKSTILRMIAGLEQPDSGKICIQGRDITRQPPWERHIGMVFQHYANFPHMSVGENIAYGLRRSSLSKRERQERVQELLDLVGMSGFEQRRVTSLSGGEQQRVAIARALAPRPEILLLDEPLSALDEKIRREMQKELRSIQRMTDTTFVYVTHDQEEALTMSDRVAVLNGGICVQCDTPLEIFQRPRTRFVAEFFHGCNVLQAQATPRDGGFEVCFGGGVWQVSSDRKAVSPGQVQVAIRSEAIDLHPEDAGKKNGHVLKTTIRAVDYRGIYKNYVLELADGQTLVAAAIQEKDYDAGEELIVGLKPEHIVILED